MSRSVKLLLDILMGAVIPILVLNNLSKPLGATTAYIVAAMVPVAWVLLDLFAITRKFNFITSYAGFTSIVAGMLAFWFVDGVLFAVKDTVGFMLRVALFGGSLLLGKPILQLFFAQALNPDTPKREAELRELLREPPVHRAVVLGTLLATGEALIEVVVNFLLNLNIVVAKFGTDEFNQQVAQVNAITRVALTIPSFVVLAVAMWLIYRAIFKQLPSEEGKDQLESDFWDLMNLREQQRSGVVPPAETAQS